MSRRFGVWDLGFGIGGVAITTEKSQIPVPKSQILTVVTDQRLHIVSVEFLAAFKEIQLEDEKQALNLAAETLDEIDDRPGSAAGGEKIVNDKNAVTFADGVAMHFKSILAILEIV